VGLAVHFLKLLDPDVGVALGGREGGVPEEFLDRADVGARSSRWVANECRRAWGEIFRAIAAIRT